MLNKRFSSLIPVLLLVAILVAANLAQAQTGGTIGYGSSVEGSINAQAPLVIFNFSGAAGDLATVQVIGAGDGLDPSVSLLAPSQQQLAASDNDFFSAGAGDARLSSRLPETGIYSLLVGSANNTTGRFVLRLSAAQPVVSTQLNAGVPVAINIPLGAPSQSYSFSPGIDAPATLALGSDTPGFGFTAEVRKANGELVALLGGGLQSASLTVPAGGGPYQVTVSSANPETQGTISIAVDGAAASSAPPPVATEEAIAPAPADALAGIGPNDACTATPTGNATNLRGGPGTNFDIQNVLQAGQTLAVSGQANGADGFVWWQLSNGAWARSDVVRTAGACDAVPTVQAPAASDQQPAQPVATEEVSAPPQATEEAAPPETATEEAAPAAPAAPADTDQYILEVERDSNTQFSEVISSPEGDTRDNIFVRITGLSNQPPNNFREFSFTLVCSGTGAEFVQWGTGQGGGLTCGGSINRTFTNDSDTVLLNVRLPEGSGQAFVNYTIVINKLG